MKLWIDTEFNGYKGDLISMALVDEQGKSWYQVLKFKGTPVEWVALNVMPYLNKRPVTMQEFQRSLKRFLSKYDKIHIISDFPVDIHWFCEVLLTGPGTRLPTPPLTMEIDRRITATKAIVHHNALSDALALRESWYAPLDNITARPEVTGDAHKLSEMLSGRGL